MNESSLDMWTAATALAAGGSTLLFVYGILVLGRKRSLRARLVAVANIDAAELQVAQTSESGPRVLIARVGRLLAHALPSPVVNRFQMTALRAGLTTRTAADILLGVRLAAVIAGGALSYAFATSGQGALGIIGAIVIALTSLFGVDMYLHSRGQSRRRAADRDLPTVLDLLTLTLAAGLGFDNALEMILVHFEGPLSDEMTRYLQEIRQLGARRTIAFRDVPRRLGDPPDLVDFVEAINRAQQMGTGMLAAVESQLVLLRQERHRRVASAAQRAPVRMLIPMTVFMLPVLMLIVLAPVGLRVASSFGGMH